MNGADRFALIELDRESRDPMALARAFAEARSTPVQDQVLAAKRAWGILAEDLAESEARSLGRPYASGVKCALGPAAALAELPDGEPSRHSVRSRRIRRPHRGGGLTVTTTATRTEEKGPSAAQKARQRGHHDGHRPAHQDRRPEALGGKTREEQRLVFYLDLYYEGPARRLRSMLPASTSRAWGSACSTRPMGNLKLLLGDLVEAAPEAWLNHGTRVLLEGKPIRTMGYGSVEDLDREARWLLTLRALGI